jgi:cell division protein FtsB
MLARKSVLLLNIAVFGLVGWGFSGEFLRNRSLQAEIDRLEAEAGELESKNLEIARLGRRFTSDEVVEREARLKLGLQKPGESVIIVRDVSPRPEGPPAGAPTSDEPPVSHAMKWWRYFFH